MMDGLPTLPQWNSSEGLVGDSHYMKDPSDVFKKFLEYDLRSHEWQGGYQAGVMAMALELITVAKTIEALPSENPAIPEEIISTIYTLLNGMDLTEQASVWYDRVADWRRPKFVGDEPSLVGIADVGQLSLPLDPEHASSRVSPLGAAARLGTLHAVPDYGQSPGLPSGVSALLHGTAVNAKQIESERLPDESGPPADD
jgi:hypothetical protein